MLPFARPPWPQIDELITTYLSPRRRAGQGFTRQIAGGDEASIYQAAGFAASTHLDVPRSAVVRSVDEIVASVFSLSSAAPHLFGDRRSAFEAELRGVSRAASATGRFSETMREIALEGLAGVVGV